MNPRVVLIPPHSGIGSRHLLSPPHAWPPGQTVPSPESPSSLATITPEIPPSGQSSSRLSRFESRIPTRRLRPGQLEPVTGRAGQRLGAPRSGRAPRPPGIAGSSGQPQRPRPRRRPCKPRQPRGGTGVRAMPLSARRERDGVVPPCPARPTPRALLPARERSSPRSSAGPMLAVGGSERRGCRSHAARGPASVLPSPARPVEVRAASTAPGPTHGGSGIRPWGPRRAERLGGRRAGARRGGWQGVIPAAAVSRATEEPLGPGPGSAGTLQKGRFGRGCARRLFIDS